jgi:hypothetical protein
LDGLDQNPSGSLRKYNFLVKNLTCKTLREKPDEGKRVQCSKRLTKSIFREANPISSKSITNSNWNHVPPLTKNKIEIF